MNLKNKELRIITKDVSTNQVVHIKRVRLDEPVRVKRIETKTLEALQAKGLLIIIE